SPLAGLPPGEYGDWAIEPSGRIVVAGTPYLAGSNLALETGIQIALEATGWPIERALAAVTTNPARLLGCRAPRLAGGEPASFVIFRRPDLSGFALERSCVLGQWADDP